MMDECVGVGRVWECDGGCVGMGGDWKKDEWMMMFECEMCDGAEVEKEDDVQFDWGCERVRRSWIGNAATRYGVVW